MNILIIGTGAVSEVLVNFLKKDKNVKKIICATNNLAEAKKRIIIDKHNEKILLKKVDASKEQELLKISKNVDLIINASLPDFNEVIMKTALKVKANYQDLCSLLKDFKTPEQLKYHEAFKKNNLLALINTGVSPGITNLLAKSLSEELEKLETIKIRVLEEQITKEYIPSWSVKVTADEITAPTLIYKNKKYSFVTPFDDSELFEFPSPYGKREVVNIYGDEISTIPKYLNLKNVSYKAGGTDIVLAQTITKLGLLNTKPVKIGKQKVIPLEFFSKISPKIPTRDEIISLIKNKTIQNGIFISSVIGEGVKNRKKIMIEKTIMYPDLIKIQEIMPGTNYISYATGLTAYLFFKSSLEIKEKGVLPPEAIPYTVNKKILRELEKYCTIITKKNNI
jgi:saccharopine dehydrogenase (NAD+, L-lysine forming)